MGSVAQPFAVDLESVRKVLGSNDVAFIEKVKKAKRYDTYADQSEDVDFDELLEDLIVRYIKPENRRPLDGVVGVVKGKTASGLRRKYAHEYGYALLVICDALGTYLSPQGDIFYAGKVWKEANALFKSKGMKLDLDRMWKTEKLFDIPDIEDFPAISHYTKDEVSYLLTELNKIGIDEKKANHESDDFSPLQQLLKAFRDGLQICKDKNVEWVSFLH
ncbi:DUF7691 family protein [Chryseolinea lacunae]|uniref:DUF7691 domain-containing protein n=1 Tax=Chryseolinea lacunae TaxID=2801331 RepID=A0ABS1L2H7_9BACT|nr:hypothetical protein [Chryseolinea lacunae]MBL0745648.1 hypothetical protein [Chryseolinea lacunae]